MRVELTARARNNLAAIGEHYAEVGGHALAHRMVTGIKHEIMALADNPRLGSAYDLAPGVRRLVVANGAFLVFYRVTDRVQVVHVRRAKLEPVSVKL
jgi:plasmid stabilization system protein ParE